MKKIAHYDRSPARRPVAHNTCCNPDFPCFQCSMIRLTSHRFAIFYKKFGRVPGPNDELFFDSSQPEPVRASHLEIKHQIFAAAEAQGLNFFILLSYLGLTSARIRDERPL
jgi:hypothetical protein